MADATRLFQALIGEAAAITRPLAVAARDPDQPDGLLALADEAHLRLDELLADPSSLVGIAARLAEASAPLADLTDDGDVTAVSPAELDALAAAVRATIAAAERLDDLETLPETEPVEQVGRRLVDHLVASHLRAAHPLMYWTLRLVGVLRGDPEVEPARFHTDAVTELLRDPSAVLRAAYGWGTDDADVYPLLVNLHQVLGLVGIPSRFEYPDTGDAATLGTDPERTRPDRHLRILLLVLPDDPVPALVGASVLPLTRPDDEAGDGQGHDGLAVVPYGTTAIGRRRALSAGWEVTFRASVDAALRYGFVVRPGQAGPAALDDDEVPQDLRVEASFESVNRPGEPTFVVGDPEGSRFEIGQMGVRATAVMGDDREFVVAFPLLGCRVAVDVGDGDGFLRALLGGGAAQATFDLTTAWSSRHGLHFDGSGGLSSTVVVHDAFGPVEIRNVRLAARPLQGGGVALSARLTAAVGLGPVHTTVEGVGVELRLNLPEDRDARLGLADVALEATPPTGVGLELDAGPVTGGGHLAFDPEVGRYAGAVALDVQGIALNAVGIVTTEVPGDDYALLVVISSDDFTPIDLGLGFTLNGVGGLLGVNRAAAVDELRAGVKDHTLDAVLFPDDPVDRIGEIVGDLANVFPPTADRHLVGPAAVIGWGTPTALTMDLALVLELPDPVRLVALGQLRARLPSDDDPLVWLNMDAVGVVDFDDGSASLDATLYDSRLADYAVSGDVALRARWKSDPVFVLAVGGLHPRFPAPSGFPDLDRLSISLTSGDNPRLRLDAYLALTSNTAQFGALLDLHVAGAGFSLDGYLQFDALLQFAPFGFVVDLAGGVTVTWHGHTLAGVTLELTLSGPAPLRVRGSATFSLWRFSHSIDVELTVGADRPVPPLPAVDPLPELVDAVGDARNWSSVQASGSGVTLRDVGNVAAVLAHPSSLLEVRQRVVPLDTAVVRYGRRPIPGGPWRYEVAATLGDDGVEPAVVRDHFAPAAFFDLSDGERLSRPSFERLPCGVRLTPPSAVTAPDELTTTAELGYRTRIIDSAAGPARDDTRHVPPSGRLVQRTRRRDRRRTRDGIRRRIAVDDPSYVVARIDDLTVEHRATPAGTPLTYTEAAEVLQGIRRRDPQRAEGLRVAPRHVAVGAVFAPQRPGETPAQPGEYLEHDLSGEPIGDPRQVTMEPGDEPLPPTQEPDRVWLWIGPPHVREPTP